MMTRSLFQSPALPSQIANVTRQLADAVNSGMIHPQVSNVLGQAVAQGALTPAEVQAHLNTARAQGLSPASTAAQARTNAAARGGTFPARGGLGQLQPESPYRLPDRRYELLGFQQALVANTPATISIAPQVTFIGRRLVIPSFVANLTLQNLTVGTKPNFGGTGSVPSSVFSEKATGMLLDFDPCPVGMDILLQMTSTAGQTVTGAIWGEVDDGVPYPALENSLKWLQIPVTNVGAGATATINVNSQWSRFHPRKMLLDDVATVPNFTISVLEIGVNTQIMNGQPVPAAAFSDLGQDIWFDWDEIKVGQQLQLTVTNTDGGAAHNFGGIVIGDAEA